MCQLTLCFGDLADRHLHAQFMLNESLKLQSHTLASRQPWNGFSLGTATSALYTAVSKLNLNKISPRERTVAKLAGSVSVIAATRFAAIRADSGIAHDKSDAAFTVVAFHADASGPGELLFESIVVNRRIEPRILHFASRRDDGHFTDKTEDLRRVGQIRYNIRHGEVSLVVVVEDRNHTESSPIFTNCQCGSRVEHTADEKPAPALPSRPRVALPQRRPGTVA